MATRFDPESKFLELLALEKMRVFSAAQVRVQVLVANLMAAVVAVEVVVVVVVSSSSSLSSSSSSSFLPRSSSLHRVWRHQHIGSTR
jgi:hypothetical protein